jgi:uncharacterized Zn finger protein
MAYQTDLKKLHAITQDDIDDMLTRSVLTNAKKILRQEGVFNAVADGTLLLATVEGTDFEDYEVEISVNDSEIYAKCTCPYEWEGWCKHIGAVLLTWIENRNEFDIIDVEGLNQLDNISDSEQLQEAAPVRSPQDIWIKEYQRLLTHLKIAQLRQIATNRGIALEQKLKELIIEELGIALADQTTTQALVDQLDTLSLELLVNMNLAAPSDYGMPLANLKPLRESNHSQDVIRKKVNELLLQGMLLPFIQRRVTYYVLPRIVRRCLPSLSGIVEPYHEQNATALDVKTRDFATLNQKLYQVWNYIAENVPKRRDISTPDPIESQWTHLEGWTHLPDEIAEIKRRGQFFYTQYQSMTVPASAYQLREPDRKTLCTRLGSSDEEIEFYYILLAEIQAVKGHAGQPINANNTQIQSLLNMPPGSQLIALLQAWQNTTRWSEMDNVRRASDDICVRRNVTFTTYKLTNLYQEWREGRMTVFRFMSLLQENQWISVRSFQKIIFELMPNLAHFLSHTGVWWLESIRRKKQFGATLDDWLASYGRLVIAILEGPLNWLGAVDLGYRNDKLEAIRLTPAGAFVLGRRETLFDQQTDIVLQEAIKLQDDLTASIMPGCAPIELYNLLGDIGQLESATPQHFLYRLTANSVQSQFDQGQSAQTLLAALEDVCPIEIPKSWKCKLEEWQNNYGKLHLYQGMALIELADEYLGQELMVKTLLRKNIIYQFSPRLIAIRPDAVDDLIQEMEKKGYTPRVE